MIGFYTLRRFIELVKMREKERGRLNLSVARNVDPKFKHYAMEKLKLEEREFIGIVSALKALGFVRGGRLVEIKSLDELYEKVLDSRVIKDALYNIARMRGLFLETPIGNTKLSTSFSGEIAREIGKRIFPGAKSTHAVDVLLGLLRILMPFVVIPGRAYKESNRDVNLVVLSLIELGGLASIERLYERSRETDRLVDLEDFLKALSKSIIIHGEVKMVSEETIISKQARIALARFLRADKDYDEISVGRINAFTDRILSSQQIIDSAKASGFSVEEGKIFKSELFSLIDESISSDPQDFLSAYGSVRVKLSVYDNLLIKFSARKR